MFVATLMATIALALAQRSPYAGQRMGSNRFRTLKTASLSSPGTIIQPKNFAISPVPFGFAPPEPEVRLNEIEQTFTPPAAQHRPFQHNFNYYRRNVYNDDDNGLNRFFHPSQSHRDNEDK